MKVVAIVLAVGFFGGWYTAAVLAVGFGFGFPMGAAWLSKSLADASPEKFAEMIRSLPK